MVHTLVMQVLATALVVASGDVRLAGRSEVMLRESDVLFSRESPLECVLGFSIPDGLANARIDVATIELTVDADGEVDSFVPFLLAVQAVEPDGQGGYRAVSKELAREFVLLPGEGRRVRMMATALVRRWVASGRPSHMRIMVEDPAASDRPAGSIRLVAADGALGKVILLVR